MFQKFMNCTCADKWGEYAPLVMRLALGAVFAWHGYDKVFSKGVDGISMFLGSLGFPMSMLFAYILSYGELIAGILLIVGYCTHWVAKYCAIVALVAFALVHAGKGFSVQGGGYEYIMLIFAASVSLMITGSGKYSLEKMLK